MTDKQALTAARKLIGKNAAISRRARPVCGKSGVVLIGTHEVGHRCGIFFTIKGSGMNWAEAITDATRRIERRAP